MTMLDGFCLEFPEEIFRKGETPQSMSLNEPIYPNFYSNNNSLIEVSFLPGEPTSRSILGEIVKTSNFIVKIGLKQKTNLLSTVCFILNIKKTVRFRKFIDFHYLPFCENFYWNKRGSKENVLRKLKYFSTKKSPKGSIPVDLLPPFSHRSLIFLKDFNFTQIKNNKRRRKKENILQKTIVPVGIDQRSFGENEVDFKYNINFIKDVIPHFPLKKFRKSLKTTPVICLGMILRLFKKRPIWTVKEISKFVQPQIRRYIKRVLPFISYRFKGKNPFPRTWIRLSFDPKKNNLARIYNFLERDKKKKSKTDVYSL